MMLLLFSFSGIICHGDCWNIRVCDLFVFQSPEVNIVGEEMGSQLQGSKIMLLVTWNYGSTHFLLSNMSVIIVVSILFVFFFLSNKLHKILKEHSRCHISQTSWFYVMLLSDLPKKDYGLAQFRSKSTCTLTDICQGYTAMFLVRVVSNVTCLGLSLLAAGWECVRVLLLGCQGGGQ